VPFDLPATLLCQQERADRTYDPPETPSQFAVFKTARSGSTWFHAELTAALAYRDLIAMQTWEPYGDRNCYHKEGIDHCQHKLKRQQKQQRQQQRQHLESNATYAKRLVCPRNSTLPPTQAEGVQTILDRSFHCPRHWDPYGIPGGPAPYNPKTKDKCAPAEQCWRLPNLKPADLAKRVTVIDFNPRFADTVEFEDIGLNVKEAVVVNLRRTNLVRQSYSKYHHGGVSFMQPNENGPLSDGRGVGSATECTLSMRNTSDEPRKFTLELLLCGVWHYTIGDQEFSSAAAIRAAASVGRHPYVILYEDLLEHGAVVKEHLFKEHLQLLANDAHNRGRRKEHPALQEKHQRGQSRLMNQNQQSENTKVNLAPKHPKKKHKATHMCSFKDVPCDTSELEGLTADRYPCLYKQFHGTESSVWGMPLLPDGTISVFGDCDVLDPLDPHHSRQLSELY
jgi:hypothetical protein